MRQHLKTLSMFGTVMLLACPLLPANILEISQESEAKAVSSAVTPATPEQVVAKVEEAYQLLKKEGEAALPKFKGQDSEFIFGGTYIWIHDMDGIMILHPIKYQLEGKQMIGLKDLYGKRFFTAMNETAKTRGSGWVDYWWPKPGEKKPSQKVSYVKLIRIGGREWVLGCGLYDLSKARINELVGR